MNNKDREKLLKIVIDIKNDKVSITNGCNDIESLVEEEKKEESFTDQELQVIKTYLINGYQANSSIIAKINKIILNRKDKN